MHKAKSNLIKEKRLMDVWLRVGKGQPNPKRLEKIDEKVEGNDPQRKRT